MRITILNQKVGYMRYSFLWRMDTRYWMPSVWHHAWLSWWLVVDEKHDQSGQWLGLQNQSVYLGPWDPVWCQGPLSHSRSWAWAVVKGEREASWLLASVAYDSQGALVSKKWWGHWPWRSHPAWVDISPGQGALCTGDRVLVMVVVRLLPSAAGRHGSAPAHCTSPSACCSAARWLGLSLNCQGPRWGVCTGGAPSALLISQSP